MTKGMTLNEIRMTKRIRNETEQIGLAAELFSGNRPAEGSVIRGRRGKQSSSDFDDFLKLVEANFASKLGKSGGSRPRFKIRRI